MAAAEEVLFNAFRQQRDARLNWPSRVAPLMAADLGVPADRMTEVLIEHVPNISQSSENQNLTQQKIERFFN